jgi:hypothetical protein
MNLGLGFGVEVDDGFCVCHVVVGFFGAGVALRFGERRGVVVFSVMRIAGGKQQAEGEKEEEKLFHGHDLSYFYDAFCCL